MTQQPSAVRQGGLLVMVVVATLVLLGGVWGLVSRAGSSGGARVTGSPATSLAPVAGSTGSPTGSGAASIAASIGPGGSGEVPTITLTGAGDIANCAFPGAARTADLLVTQTGSIFTAGDNAYGDDSTADFSRCYAPTWGRVLDRTLLPAAGNHDWQTAGAAGYLAYFGGAAAPQGTTWYSMDMGAWHVVVLDSDCAQVGGCDDASPQGRWLASDLAASAARATRCTLAIWHHPRFSSGLHGGDTSVAPFWRQLQAAGAELVVNGHDHDYERFAPQDPTGRVERPGGIREIVVGTGGSDLRGFATIAANSEFRQAGTYGVLRLTLHPFNYDWEFLPASGAVADSGSTPCH